MTPADKLAAVVAKVPHENHVWRWDADELKRYIAEISTGFTCVRCELDVALAELRRAQGRATDAERAKDAGKAMYEAIENRSTEKADMASRKWKELTKC